MARFTQTKISKSTPNTTTHEGAPAFKRDPVQAWFNMLFSSFLENQYYESSKSQTKRFIELTEKVADKHGYAFVGKAAIFARNELGMRSISQLTAAWLNDKSFQEKRNFYRGFMHRPDDVSEIFAAVDFLNGKRSHALIRGAADYISSLGTYQITKYKMNTRDKYKMVDIINLTHAKSDVVNRFMRGELESPDTWEVNIAKQQSNDERQQQWKRLVEEKKLGYMALIRNLNNILAIKDIDNDWIINYLVPQLINEKKIRESLVFPYRIYTAYKNLKVKNTYVVGALDNAFVIATSNVPFFEGNSAVILDVSGSMQQRISMKSNITLLEVGACFAATLILNKCNVDFIKFGTNARRTRYFSIDSTFHMIQEMTKNENLGYGTDLCSAFKIMRDDYDRIFVISDMQVFNYPMVEYKNDYDWHWSPNRIDRKQDWINRYKDITTYSFDLASYDNQLVPPSDNFIYLTSLSDKLFKYINILEGEQDLITLINNISF